MLVLISGPSGAGKSTFVNALERSEPQLSFSVSTTTRPPRKGETDGVQYHFAGQDEFDRLIAEGVFVEWAQVHGHRYGTRKDHLERMISRGQVPLLDLDVQGGLRVVEIFGADVVSVFVFPPSWQELERRLRARGTDDEATVQTRLANARREVGFADHYEYFIINDDLPGALSRMRAILVAERCRRVRIGRRPLSEDGPRPGP